MTDRNYKFDEDLMEGITLNSKIMILLNDMCINLNLNQEKVVNKLILDTYEKNHQDIEKSRIAFRKEANEELKELNRKPEKRNRKINKTRLIKLYEEGISSKSIAKELNIGRSTVFKIVKEETEKLI
jgi:predicted transcriptional regulator YheO